MGSVRAINCCHKDWNGSSRGRSQPSGHAPVACRCHLSHCCLLLLRHCCRLTSAQKTPPKLPLLLGVEGNPVMGQTGQQYSHYSQSSTAAHIAQCPPVGATLRYLNLQEPFNTILSSAGAGGLQKRCTPRTHLSTLRGARSLPARGSLMSEALAPAMASNSRAAATQARRLAGRMGPIAWLTCSDSDASLERLSK